MKIGSIKYNIHELGNLRQTRSVETFDPETIRSIVDCVSGGEDGLFNSILPLYLEDVGITIIGITMIDFERTE